MADNPKNDACKTYLEQTKLLVTLASAFIIAPAVFIEKIDIFNWQSICMEVCFILSVFTGYIVFGTISGTQYKGDFNVYNKGTTWFSRIQIGFFILGLILLIINFTSTSSKPTIKPKPPETNTDSIPKPPYHKDEIVQLNNIFFDFSKWALRPESYYELSKLVDTLKKYPKLEIIIQAHTDNVGSDIYNHNLSEKRASSVVQYLISQGVFSHQISSKGFGESTPLSTNDTYEGRQINRRIEFKVQKTG